jgi:hypothetical protein
MLSLVTSWMAGVWLRYVLRSGKRLMPGDERLVIDHPHQDPAMDLDLYPVSLHE